MNQDKKLVIISNEKFYNEGKNFYCDNVDLKSIPEGLKDFTDVLLIAKKSKYKRSLHTKLGNIKITANLFKFIYNIFRTFKYNNAKYLLISITPFTFFSYIFLYIFRKKIYVYLRSNGYEEYKAILGPIGPSIFYIMYTVVTYKSNIITCRKHLTKKNNYDLVYPSELDNNWLENTQVANLENPKLLYVGRLKVEKGIFSLIKIFEKTKKDVHLSIVCKEREVKLNNKNIKYLDYEQNKKSLIKIFDNYNILILPSFTEAHPKVVDESLARMRPVIIFEELNQKIQDRYGVFVSKRNANSLNQTIEFVMKNYKTIQQSIKKNKLPSKKDFILSMSKILT